MNNLARLRTVGAVGDSIATEHYAAPAASPWRHAAKSNDRRRGAELALQDANRKADEARVLIASADAEDAAYGAILLAEAEKRADAARLRLAV